MVILSALFASLWQKSKGWEHGQRQETNMLKSFRSVQRVKYLNLGLLKYHLRGQEFGTERTQPFPCTYLQI